MSTNAYCNIPCEADAAGSVIDRTPNVATGGWVLSLPTSPGEYTAAFINRLPSELLSLIFEAYANGSRLELPKYRPGILPFDDPMLTDWHPQWADFMLIMTVCRRWRAVAHNAPRFWSQVIFKGPAYLKISEEMLARSKAAPLDIRVQGAQHDDVQAYLRSTDIRRIRELHLNLPAHVNAVMETIAKSGHQAGLLRSICVNMNHLSLDIFSLSMPNLQHLDLCFHGSEIQWASFHAASRSNLSRVISLRLVVSRNSRDPSAEGRLYGILSTMPGLEVLHLDGALQRTEIIDSSDDFPRTGESGRMLLPYLSSCTILNSSASQLANFHSVISYPVTTAKLRFRVSKPTVNDGPAGLVDLLDILGLSSVNSTRQHSNLLLSSAMIDTIWRTTDEAARFALWSGGPESFPSRSPTFTSEDPPVVLELDGFLLSSTLLRNVVVPGLARMEIQYSTDMGLKIEEWFHFFTRHPNIENLHIGAGSFIHEVIYALDYPIERSDSWESEQLIIDESGQELSWSRSSLESDPLPTLCLPNLATLTIEDKPFRGLERLYPEPAPEFKEETAHDIVDCFFERCNHGLQLQHLHFLFMTDLDVATLKLLSELVVSVTWAGYFQDVVPPYFKLDVGSSTDDDSESDDDSSYYSDSDSDSGGHSEGNGAREMCPSSESNSDSDESNEEMLDGDDAFWG